MSESGPVSTLPVATGWRGWLRQTRPFLIWLVLFYSAWLAIVSFGGYWETVRAHWPIALAMSFGSYIAGSTPMGGGTVGFPVLVLLFEMPGSLGRNFGLAVQSIGMVSASIYIFSVGRPLHWSLLRPALFGALVGTPLGAAFIAPLVPDLWVKLLFGVLWASFGIMHLVKLRELVAAVGISHHWRDWDGPIGWVVGLTGGVVASITGVGIDMLIYATLVLLYRSDLKIAIPTSVVLMAFTSLVGIGSNTALARLFPQGYVVEPAVFANWLAAAPVVAVGAPIGALVVECISRKPTLLIVSALCILQFVWTLVQEQVSGLALVAALLAVVGFNGIFHVLYSLGHSPAAYDEDDEPPGAGQDGGQASLW